MEVIYIQEAAYKKMLVKISKGKRLSNEDDENIFCALLNGDADELFTRVI